MSMPIRVRRGRVYLINLIERKAVSSPIPGLMTAGFSRHFEDTLTTQKVFPGDSDSRVITAMPQRAHYLHPLMAI
jgi:hypothetical protein